MEDILFTLTHTHKKRNLNLIYLELDLMFGTMLVLFVGSGSLPEFHSDMLHPPMMNSPSVPPASGFNNIPIVSGGPVSE